MGSRQFLEPLRPAPMTTTQRNALSGVGDGDVIFNSTLGALQVLIGGTWYSFGGSVEDLIGMTLSASANVEAIIRANSLDQLAPPAANLSMNTKRVTNGAAAVLSTDFPIFSQVNNGEYGDGSDGSLTFDGVATVLGLAPASNFYTLTRDIFATDITISTGVTIVSASFRIFATGTVTGAGTAAILGSNGFATGGSFTAGFAGQGVTAKTIGGSGAGAAGANTAGANGTSTTNSLGGNAGAAGAGALAAGTSGTATVPVAASGSVRSLPWAALGAVLSATTAFTPVTGGGGGGAGGGNASTNFGGAGGGGGGVLILIANHIAGSLNLTAKGGNGEAARGAGNSGGGGGGGGGVIIIVSKDVSVPTTDVTGGAGGAKTGTGTAGSSGSAGTLIKIAN